MLSPPRTLGLIIGLTLLVAGAMLTAGRYHRLGGYESTTGVHPQRHVLLQRRRRAPHGDERCRRDGIVTDDESRVATLERIPGVDRTALSEFSDDPTATLDSLRDWGAAPVRSGASAAVRMPCYLFLAD
ncbi:hypothetical protein BRC76_09040, partial [Halobacteriales archaeon QH_8_67_36]